MLEKFKLFFNVLSPEEKKQAVNYILQTQGIKPLNEGFYSGPSRDTIEKGLYSGPVNSNEKCRVCGK